MFVEALTRQRIDDRLSAGSGVEDIVSRDDNRPEIVIGLINIMPRAAMEGVESLFRRLLNAVASSAKIRLRLFALPDCAGVTFEAPQYYEALGELWNSPGSASPLDALIVTGTESKARLMTDEACWPHLQRICEWAGPNTFSTIWSCFSAHAAVLHMDNIHRQPLSEKLSGIFECEKTSSHPILKNMPDKWAVPHSRYNTLPEAELEANGYEILSRSPRAGADSFVKQYGNSQFLFLQGHLEYGPGMLLSEYCRDLKRFSLGQSAVCPRPPENYFDPTAMEAFAAAQKSMKSLPDALSTDFVNTVAASLNFDWQAPAQQLFSAWLSCLTDQKSALLNASFATGEKVSRLK